MLTPIALSHELRTLARDAISVNPMSVRHLEVPNVVVVPIADKDAIWEVFIAWQPGKAAAPVRVLIDALSRNPILNN